MQRFECDGFYSYNVCMLYVMKWLLLLLIEMVGLVQLVEVVGWVGVVRFVQLI